MIVSTELAGLFGPFIAATYQGEPPDRVLCDGAVIPYTVVGNCTILDIEVPDGMLLEGCILVDGQLVPRPEPANEQQ